MNEQPTNPGKKPITIIAYHSIGDGLDPYTMSPAAFAAQMRLISQRYEVIRLRDIARALDGPRSSRLAILTFDDGFLDFFTTAYPILEGLTLPATVFVPSGFVGGYNDWDANGVCARKPLMAADDLRQLQQSGLVDFGSHTIDHVRMTQQSRSEMRRQAIDSQSALEALTGSPVLMFAYPYGMLDDYSDETDRVLSEAGYRIAVTAHWGTRNSASETLRLRRVFFREQDDERALIRKIEGWYDWIAWKERAGFAARKLRGAGT